MMVRFFNALVCAAFSLSLPAGADEAPETLDAGPVVIELFTSQGCSACPAADALMEELAPREDVLALSLHVDYWDYIGWKDSFAQPQFTRRQKAYATANGWRMIYTPQMIVGGISDVVGNEALHLADAIAAHRDAPSVVGIGIAADGPKRYIVEIAPLGQKAPPALILLVRYMPSQTVAITHGENAGRVVNYANIVTRMDAITEWDGAGPRRLPLEIEGPDEAAVIVQQEGHGAVLAAARLP